MGIMKKKNVNIKNMFVKTDFAEKQTNCFKSEQSL